jgi:hypothetical protein
VPRIADHLIAHRLTAQGGAANVSLSAFPFPRLFFGDGDSLSVSGNGLNLDLSTQETGGLGRLDGFGKVDISISSSSAAPFRIHSFSLTRDGPVPYHLVATASTTAGDLVAFGADRLPFLGGLALRFGSSQLLGREAQARVPVHMNMALTSDGDRIVVVAGSTTIDGVPTGPLAEIITQAIAIKL